jgi:hypothetical protein
VPTPDIYEAFEETIALCLGLLLNSSIRNSG